MTESRDFSKYGSNLWSPQFILSFPFLSFLLFSSSLLRLGESLLKQKKSCSGILYLDPCLITQASLLHSAALGSAQSITDLGTCVSSYFFAWCDSGLEDWFPFPVFHIFRTWWCWWCGSVRLLSKMNKSQWISSLYYLCEIFINEARHIQLLHWDTQLS